MLLRLAFFLLSCTYISARFLKNGIFDNVTVIVRGPEKKSQEFQTVIDFDDRLDLYLSKNPKEIITITKQFIPKLDPDSVSNLVKVQNLTLSRNGIREIRRGAFRNLPKLKVLDLSYNMIEEIRFGVFNELKMRDLFLDHNHILKISYKAFSGLNLSSLFLSHNRISRWSKDWFFGTSVLHLDLGFNLIQELPSRAFELMKACDNVSVVFTANQLRKINSDVFIGFSSFKHIGLDHNVIDNLKMDAFNGIKSIQSLNLNNNSLTDFSSDLLKSTKVEILMLEDNKIRCISTDVFDIQELDIDGNPITCFCVQMWLNWREFHSNPSIYHITNLEQDCI